MPKKSGQTALILVIVTMVTVLGIGVASSTQSNINLRNTVYSTQSEQALACAEAGAEDALGKITEKDPAGDGSVSMSTFGFPTSSTTLGNCTYEYSVVKYPDAGADGSEVVIIPKLEENTVQELKNSSGDSSIRLEITPLSSSPSSSIAIYLYGTNSNTLDRKFYHLTSDNSSKPTDFASATVSGGVATIDLTGLGNYKYIRLRPLYSDVSIKITGFSTDTGYFVKSTGNAGIVKRVVNAYRY